MAELLRVVLLLVVLTGTAKANPTTTAATTTSITTTAATANPTTDTESPTTTIPESTTPPPPVPTTITAPKVAAGAVCIKPSNDVSPGDPCTDPNAECTGTSGSEHKCTCKQTYYNNGAGQCNAKVAAGAVCIEPSNDVSPGDPCTDPNAECTGTSGSEHKCTCTQTYYNNGGSCAAKVAAGEVCIEPSNDVSLGDPCTDPNAECTGTPGSDHKCTCTQTYYNNGGSCTAKVAAGEVCIEPSNDVSPGDPCTDPNAECTGTPGSEHKCTCTPTYYDNGVGQCSAKVAAGEVCIEPSNDVSLGDPCTDPNAECTGTAGSVHKCTCTQAYYDNGLGQCSGKVAAGEVCTEPRNDVSLGDPCTNPNAECTGTAGSVHKCTCTSTYYNNGGSCTAMVAAGEVCIEPINDVSPGDPCTDPNAECTGTAGSEHKCTCSQTYYDNGSGQCSGKVAAGEVCTEPRNDVSPGDPCTDPNAECTGTSGSEHKCTCTQSYYNNGGSCTAKVAAGEVCIEPSNDVSPGDPCTDPNAECIGTAWSEHKCTCKQTYYDNGAGQCSAKVAAGEVCIEPSNDVSPGDPCTDPNAECTGTSGSEHKCTCKQTYYNNGAGQCNAKVAAGAVCIEPSNDVSPGDPCTDPNAECTGTSGSEHKCTCTQTYYNNGGSCAAKVAAGEVCIEPSNDVSLGDPCTDPNAECTGTPGSDHKCTCTQTYYNNGGSCTAKVAAGEVCIEPSNDVSPGDPCTDPNAECTGTPGSEHKCTCTPTYYDNGAGQCSAKKPYNDPCTTDDQCKTVGAMCSQGRCVCVNNTFHESTNDTCDTKIPLTAEILTQTTSSITMNLTAGNEPTDGFRVCRVNLSDSCMHFTLAPDQTSVDVIYDELKDMTCYNFSVQATQESTHNSYIDEIEGCTSPRAPVSPQQDTTRTLFARTATINWRWTRDITNGVEFKATRLDHTPVPIHVSRYDAGSSKCYAELSGLTPSTDTDILLYAIFKNITGTAAQLTVKTTLEAPYNCTSLSNNSTSTSVVLQWTAGEGTYDYFRILYTGGAQIAQLPRESGPQYTIEHLQPGTHYSVDVKAYWDTNIVLSEPCTCNIYTLPADPTNLQVLDIHTDSFIATWDKGVTSNDDYYEITVKDVDNSSVVYESTEINTRAVVDRLQAATQYEISVVAVRNFTEDDDGPIRKSARSIFVTYTRPIPPPHGINITDVTESSFDIHWLDHEDSYFEHYSIDVVPDDGGNSDISIPSNITTHTVSNLRSGVFYTVSIYTVVAGLRSETPITETSYTVPELPDSVPKPTGSNLRSDGFNVSWDGGNDRFSEWQIHIINPTVGLVDNITVDSSQRTFDVDTLTSGTLYTLVVFTSVMGFRSQENVTLKLSTRPSDLTSGSVSSIHETNFTVTLVAPDERFDHYLITVDPAPHGQPSTFNISRQTGHFTQSGLDAATNYSLTIYTVLIVGDGELNSGSPYTLPSHTGPKPPSPVSIKTVMTESISISVNGSHAVFDSYIVKYTDTGAEKNVTANSDSTEIRIDNLTPGNSYTFNIYTVWQGTESDRNVSTASYTRPNSARNISFTSATENMMTVSWEAPSAGDVGNYTAVFACRSPNDGHVIQDQNKTTSSLTAIADGLDPGTFCLVNVTTHAGNQAGDLISKHIAKSTLEIAPGAVTGFLIDGVTNTSMDVHWTTPSTRNGVIRRYDVQVKLDTSCVKRFMLSCSDCQAANQDMADQDVTGCGSDTAHPQTYVQSEHQHSVSVGDLHPYRNYTILVIPYTVQWGDSVTNVTQTEQGVPGIPRNFNISSYTHSDVKFTWQPPSEKNGEIIGYRIVSSYKQRLCGNTEGPDMSDLEDIEIDVSDTKVTFNKSIYPYWNYTFRIIAKTIVGYGNPSLEVPVRTRENNPEKVNATHMTITNKTDTAFTVSWDAPCYPNGIITNYNICLSNDSSVAHGESPWSKCYTRSPTPTTAWFDTVIPYRNYSVTTSAENSAGFGLPSTKKTFMAEIGNPDIPVDITAQTINSSAIELRWSRPDTFTGPTSYTVTATDVQEAQIQQTCQTDTAYWKDQLESRCLVTGLDAYWNYSLVLKATVRADGSNPLEVSSKTVKQRTDEAIPGSVVDLQLTPESDVTKPRTIAVSWKPPIVRDLNGVLTGYILYYKNIKTTETQSVTDLGVGDKHYSINGIPANYTIQVAAVNNAGIGENKTELTKLDDGAPIKCINESGGTLLIQSAAVSVSDKQKQVAVRLPLSSFLCNRTSGEPRQWGIIVAEASEAKDNSFAGTISGYNNKKKTYKHWSDVKDADSIKPYLATGDTFNPGCKVQRKKRSTSTNSAEAETVDFTVGLDGECTGYCNGQLQPGRKYKIKAYVCTDAGCTETAYSAPLETESVPVEVKTANVLVPAVAGAAAGVVVIVVIVIVTLVMKRRQAGCFKKDMEATPPAGMPDIAMDPIVGRKSSGYIPQAVSLARFPDFVSTLHKDTNLLFSDAYKLLKENSPASPVTVAESQACRAKNRYTNILPFDHSRVKLLPLDDEEGSDFINANYIPGYTSRREYIATQGPMTATQDDFWRMAWEQNVDIIVMLTKLVEKGRNKCDKYWPELNEPVYYGDLVISIQSESNLADYTIRIIEIKLREETRTVRQFCYLKWPDMGCPEDPTALLSFVKTVKQHRSGRKAGPMIVHCSAGVGRTGTFIAVDHLLQHIRDHDEVDIYSLVLEMRRHRCNMVQTEDQFVYIHECLKEFITTDDDDEEEDDEHTYENTNMRPQEDNVYENTAFSKE